ncbi:MAG: autotransporter outer membrane beta-barrel domain-containing protein [Chromatiales bacterium]
MTRTCYARASAAICLFLLSGGVTAGPSQKCDSSNFSNCLNGVSSSVTNGASLRTSGADYGDIARKRRREDRKESADALFGRDTGLAAGDFLGGWGLWLGYTRSDFDSDFVFANTSLAYDADADNVLVGIDRLFGDRFVLGVSAGYQQVDTGTEFNGGGQEADGYTIAPYAAWLINDTFSIDVTGGYSPLDYDQNRISPTDGSQTRASFDSDRWFVATNLNALLLTGDWVVSGRVGFLHTEEDQDGYVETGSAASAAGGTLRTVRDRNIDLSQIVVGGDVAYNFGSFEPYALLIYRNDISRDNGEDAGGLPGAFTSVQAEDDDEFQAGFGFRLFSDFGLTGTFEWSLVEGRDSFDSNVLTLTLRAEL